MPSPTFGLSSQGERPNHLRPTTLDTLRALARIRRARPRSQGPPTASPDGARNAPVRHHGGKVGELCQAPQYICACQCEPRREPSPAPFENGVYPRWIGGVRRVISHRPAGAAERAPEALEIGDRQPARPGGRMVVAVDAAWVGAAAHWPRPGAAAPTAALPGPPRRA